MIKIVIHSHWDLPRTGGRVEELHCNPVGHTGLEFLLGAALGGTAAYHSPTINAVATGVRAGIYPRVRMHM